MKKKERAIKLIVILGDLSRARYLGKLKVPSSGNLRDYSFKFGSDLMTEEILYL